MKIKENENDDPILSRGFINVESEIEVQAAKRALLAT